jgi:hypothetical protein
MSATGTSGLPRLSCIEQTLRTMACNQPPTFAGSRS